MAALSDRIRGQPLFFWAAIIAGIVLLGLYPFAVRVLLRTDGVESDLGWVARRDASGRLAIARVDAGGPADTRLSAGDVLLAVNGHPQLPRGLGWVVFMDFRPGDTYRIRVLRGANPVEYELAVGSRRNSQRVWLIQIPLLVISFCFFASGVGVAVLSPRARVARLYAVAALLVAALLIPGGVFLGDLLYDRDRVVWLAIASLIPFVYPVIYHFLSEFPPGVARRPFWHGVTFVLYAIAAAFFPVNALINAAASRGTDEAVAFIQSHTTMFAVNDVAAPLYLAAALIAIVGVIVRNYRVVDDAGQRRRLRWVFAASIVAAAPLAILFVIDLVASLVGVEFEYFAWLRAQNIALLCLAFLPMAFSYAVVAHRVIGVEVVVRRGLRYLLAKNVLRAAVFFPLIAIVARVAANPQRTVTQILFDNPFVGGLAVAAAVGLLVRDRLERWLDKRFFRDASARDRVLLELVHDLARRDDLHGLESLVASRVERALHAQPVRLSFVDASQPQEGEEALSPDPGWAQLTVPIRSADERPVGWLLLGDKKSEEPYSREDCALLEAVAAQVAVVYENAALRRSVAYDARVKQEVLARIDATGFNLLRECPVCGVCYDHGDEVCRTDGHPLSLSLPIERTIDHRYRLEHVLGRGGMGSVYAATDVRLGRAVAVKVLRDAALSGEASRRRFHREARACARLHHDRIVTVYDYGTTGHDVHYLVMEKLAGRTLRVHLQQRGPLPPSLLADWFAQMLDGLESAHTAGVIHRDLKPENVFVTERHAQAAPTITLLDFGLAKLNLGSDEDAWSLTTPGSVMGTLAYMSPEQLLGSPVDARTDLYTTAVIALEALTGRNPFQRETPQETIAAILHEPARVAPIHPAGMEITGVLQRALAKSRDQRFASAREMQSALIAALRSCPDTPGTGRTAGDADPTTL